MNYLKIKEDNDRYFGEHSFPQMTSEYVADVFPVKRERKEPFVLAENTRKQTAVECILENGGKHIIALNFANALFAGGAYTVGGSAQEESLCRASMLYYAIKDESGFYGANLRHGAPDYTDGMIYSRNVPVIRNDGGEMLGTPVLCDFITCPAVNRYEAAELLMPKEKTNEIMERRIAKIVFFAAEQLPELIILGAFGCGAFGNDRNDILPMFERAVNSYCGGEAEIIFAIP